MSARRVTMRLLACATMTYVQAHSAHAVTLNPKGLGEVLLYPYYTVNGGNTTLLSVVNTTTHGKALRIRFREGRDGREVLGFNIYLSPLDVWTAALFDLNGNGTGPANLTTNDTSCTVPSINPGTGVPPADGVFQSGSTFYVPFLNYAYVGANSDSGPTDLARTREGHVDIIEMGEVTDASQRSLTAITHVNGVPADCQQIVDAWTEPDGYWVTNSNIDLAAPAGGLYGSAAIINVAEGTMMTFNAEAIDGFSDVIQHTPSGSLTPDLNTAVTDSTAGITSAYVPISGKLVQADYSANTQAIDAVSAVLMADTMYNEFVVTPSVGAESDWLITFPTKRYYVDPSITGSAIAPFPELFGESVPGMACTDDDLRFFNRDEQAPVSVEDPPLPPPSLCFESTVLSFSVQAGSGTPVSALASSYPTDVTSVLYPLTEGHGILNFNTGNQALRPAKNGDIFDGLPAIGFLAVSYINANVTPGVLANYTGTFPHKATVSCINSTGGVCP